MTLLEGPHVSSDVALVDGEPKWWRHATGLATGEGMFDRWTIHAAADPPLEAACGAWIAKNLQGFTGILNLETIGGRIIEAHLRLSDQWPDLYGAGWTEAFVGLYRDRVWRYADTDRRDGFSIVLCGPWGRRYRHPPPDAGAGGGGHAGGIERADHLPRGQGRRSATPCRRAGSGWRSSMPSIWRRGRRRARCCAQHFLGAEPAVNIERAR